VVAKTLSSRAHPIRFSSRVDFIVIYIEEAHPRDGWATGGNNPKIASHCALPECIVAAKMLSEVAAPACAVYSDPMDDAACRAYGALFERLNVIVDGTVAFQGGRGPSDYRVEDVEAWLTRNVQV
jgi:hypothetical protein